MKEGNYTKELIDLVDKKEFGKILNYFATDSVIILASEKTTIKKEQLATLLSKIGKIKLVSSSFSGNVEFSTVSDEKFHHFNLTLIIENEKIKALTSYKEIRDTNTDVFKVLHNQILTAINYNNKDNAITPLCIFWKDSNLLYHGMSDNLLTLNELGELPNIYGKTDAEIYDEATAKVYNEDDIKLLNREITFSNNDKPVTKNGITHYYFTTKMPLYDNDKIVGIMGFGLDITKNVEIAKKEKRSSNMLRLIIESNPSAIFWKDLNSRYIGGNKKFVEATGFSSFDEIMGKDDYYIYTKETAEKYIAGDNLTLKNKEFNSQLEYSENRNGNVLFIETTKKPIIENGEITGIIGFFKDVTEKIEAEKKFDIEKKSLRYSLENSGLNYFERFIKENLTVFDSKSRGIYDLPVDFEHSKIRALIPYFIYKEDQQLFKYNLISCLQQDSTYQEFECRVITNQKKIIFKKIKLITIFDKENNPNKIIGTLQDIQEYKELEQKFTAVLSLNKITSWDYFPKTNKIRNLNSIRNNNIRIPLESSNSIIPTNIHPDDVNSFIRLHAKLNEGKSSISEIFRFKSSNGEWSYYRISYTTIFDENGNLLKCIGSSYDITERIETEKAFKETLAQQKKKNNKFFSSYTVNLSQNKVIDYQGTSQRIHQKYNIPSTYTELIEQCCNFSPKENLEKIKKDYSIENLIKNYRNGKTEINKAHRFLDKNKGLWLNISSTIMKDPLSSDLIVFFMITDITKEKIKENFLFYLANSQFPLAILVNLDDNTYFTLRATNKENKNRTSYGTNFFKNIKNNNLTKAITNKEEFFKLLSKDNITKKLKTKSVILTAISTIINEKETRYQCSITYQNKEKNFLCITFNDITEIYMADKLNQVKLTKALEEANKANKAKTTFLSAMSHDIRTPLNAILGMTQLAIEEPSNQDSIIESLNIINASSTHLLSIINDILDMSHIESGKMKLIKQPFILSEECNSLLNRLKPLSDKNGQKLILETSIIHDNVVGDSIKIHRMIENLVNNAIKFSYYNSTIKLSIKELEGTNDKSTYEIKVKDDGCGISEEQCKLIFNSFYRTGSAAQGGKEGTGLGLAITKTLVKSMNGKIEVESEIGKYTVFTITLELKTVPYYVNNENKKKVITFANLNKKVDLSKVNILLVEDNKINAFMTKKWMNKLNIKSSLALNGREACDILSTENNFDLILMDIQMPIMDGYQATKEIRSSSKIKNNNIPIIAMSANTFQEDIEKSLEMGMNAHLGKPVDIHKLYELIVQYTLEEKG